MITEEVSEARLHGLRHHTGSVSERWETGGLLMESLNVSFYTPS